MEKLLNGVSDFSILGIPNDARDPTLLEVGLCLAATSSVMAFVG
jgi:hypothetical protein